MLQKPRPLNNTSLRKVTFDAITPAYNTQIPRIIQNGKSRYQSLEKQLRHLRVRLSTHSLRYDHRAQQATEGKPRVIAMKGMLRSHIMHKGRALMANDSF